MDDPGRLVEQSVDYDRSDEHDRIAIVLHRCAADEPIIPLRSYQPDGLGANYRRWFSDLPGYRHKENAPAAEERKRNMKYLIQFYLGGVLVPDSLLCLQ